MTPHEAVNQIMIEYQGAPFKWYERDCACLVRRIRELIGAPIELNLPKYASEKGALRALKSIGYNGLGDACEALLGEPLETPLFANIGDIMLAPADGDWDGALAVKISDTRILLAYGDPLVFQTAGFVNPETGRALTLKAWRLI